MLDPKQKNNLLLISFLVAILALITFWRRTDYHYKDNTDYVKINQAYDREAYKKYLDALQIDPVASQAVYQQIMSVDDVRKEVEKTLETDRDIQMPEIADSEIKISGAAGSQAVVDYIQQAATVSWVLKNRTADDSQNMFAKDKTSSDDLALETQKQLNKLKDIAVPREAAGLQKNQLAALDAYRQLADLSRQYSRGEVSNPWPEMYKQYSIVNDAMREYNQNLNRLADKYKIAGLTLTLRYAENENSGRGFSLIPKAYALFGVGDLSVTVGDIPRIIREAIQDGLEASFAQFMGSFIQALVAKIESNYLISNFLYYSDALVSGQYADDYLNKYVSDSFDRQIIKKIMPQFSCNSQDPKLKQLFEAQAQQYLGFDPKGMDPKDPNFNDKLARVGDFLSQPEGWQLHYQNLARQTQSEAELAVTRELTSNGLKTPRDVNQKSISLSVSAIVSTQRAALGSVMNLGIATAKNFISQFVSTMVQSLMNQFVFRGATSIRGSATIGVLKEQSTCLAAAQTQALVPLENIKYTAPTNIPTESQLLQEQCAKYPDACKPKNSSAAGGN